MASDFAFVQHVINVLNEVGNASFKRMFGEYGIYLDDIYIGAICDNQLFFKVTEEARGMLMDEVLAPMYKGAKPSFLIEQIDRSSYVCELAAATRDGLIKASIKPVRKQSKSSK